MVAISKEALQVIKKEKGKKGDFGGISLLVLFFGSVLIVSAAVLNSTDNSSYNTPFDSTLLNLSFLNESIMDNSAIENISGIENVTLLNETLNLTVPIENITTINETPIKKIKNLSDIVKKNENKLNAETEEYLKNINGKKEERNYLVKFRSSIDENRLVNVTLEKKIDKFKVTEIKGKAEDIGNLIEDDEIEFIELEQDVKVLGDNTPFNIKKVRADSAWNSSKGYGVKVAVLDTGIALHDDLTIAGGVSFVDNNYYDSNGHGTAVAGVIASLLNDEGLAGTAPSVDLYSVKIMQGSTGDLSNAIAGIEWVIDNNINIVSMSFGFDYYSQIFKEVLEEAYANNILLIAASGNEGTDNILYPAKYDTVIAVGATTSDDNLAYFSSYGFEQELVAPGVDINSTALGDGYSVSSGTSLAAPHVAGVAALIKAFNNSLTNQEIRAKLRNDALDLGEEGKDDLFGYGVVQANLQANNLTLINLSYFYEIFNISNFGLPNITYNFWLNGTGSVDDVDFMPGYYLVNINYNVSFKKSYIYNVSENGTIFILGTTVQLDDYYSLDGSSPTDGIAWVNDGLTVKVASTTVPTPEGECYWIDGGGGSGQFNYCYFDTTTHKNECDSDPDITCGGATNCQIGTLISQQRGIINYASARSGTSKARVYDDCTTPGSGNEQSDTLNYYVIDKKRWRCTGLASYVAEGWYGTDWVTIDIDSCPTGQVCVDSENVTEETYSINPCQNPPAEQICSGTISAIVTDSKNNPLTTVRVYSNSVFNGSVDNDGNRLINYTSVTCGSSQSITIKCSDNTICDSKSSSVDSNGDYDSLAFTCNICVNKTDLSIKTSDVSIKSQSNKHNITVLINVEKVTASNVKVDFRGQNLKGDITQNQTKTISVTQYVNQNVSVLWDLNKTDFVSITVDFTNIIAEVDESNNYVKKATRPLTKAYVDVATDYPVVIDAVKNYLGQYIEVVSSGQDVNIYVGRKNSNIPTGEQQADNQRWELKDNLVRFNSKREGLPYNGIAVKKNDNIYVVGNEIDGELAALRKIVDNQEFYFSKSVPERIDYISEEDLDGLFVFDYLHTDENQQKYRQNTANFGKVVENVLNANVYSLAIKRVLTYNDNTSLRIKHVNAELGSKYKNFSNPQPIVLQRGIHSNLFTWEDFGFDLARGQVTGAIDNKARDIWLTELIGGPNTECPNCPVYTFDNLSTYYWPALIAGVQKYSNQNNLSYVGYSLGCSVALDSLEKYNMNGKQQAGFYNNGSDWVVMSMMAQPIDTFIGIACPGNFTELSRFMEIFNNSFVKAKINLPNHTDDKKFRREIINHIENQNLRNFLHIVNSFTPRGSNMSIEIYQEFYNWINNPNEPKLGLNVNINNFAIIEGKSTITQKLILKEDNDLIVNVNDIKEICKNVNSGNKYYVRFPGLLHVNTPIGDGLADSKKVRLLIKNFLDKKIITDTFFENNDYDLISNKQNCE